MSLYNSNVGENRNEIRNGIFTAAKKDKLKNSSHMEDFFDNGIF